MPLPPPITGQEPTSFAHFTITVRLPHIIDKIIEDNFYPPEIVVNLQALKAEIPQQPISLPESVASSERSYWEKYFQQYQGKNWLEAPFYLAEAYFYRRILEAVYYFQPGPFYQLDPFQKQKLTGLEDHSSFLQKAIEQQEPMLGEKETIQAHLRGLLLINLWGNRADMSLLPAQQQLLRTESQADDALIIDNVERLWHFMHKRQPERIDFILDNAGVELAGDFLLADFFLTTKLTRQVVFHAKTYPTFVSDATRKDVDLTWQFFKDHTRFPAAFADRLSAHFRQSRLVIEDHPFWNAPAHFFELPSGLQHQLSAADLLVSKGDANYRRLLGDASWPWTTPVWEAVDYLPVPCLALRTLKSEVLVGLKEDSLRGMDTSTSHWLTSGKYGLIQFIGNA